MTPHVIRSIMFVLQLSVAVGLLATKLPRRSPSARWALGLAGALLVVFALPWLNEPSLSSNPLREALTFTGTLVATVIGVMSAFDASPWPALFCATAGYTMQNLASSLMFLVFPHVPSDDAPITLTSVVISAVVYMACYLLFARRIDGRALSAIRERSMLVMFAVVALGIIGFDVVLKSDAVNSLPAPYPALLRLAHILVCCFVLFSEYEILYVRHLQAERTAMEHVLSEREAQYERARENIEGINVKLHDIRHWIRHYADDGRASIDPGALEDIAREVSVYDSTVETGNEVLDVILTEKSLACERHSVTLTCMADGSALRFMRPTDLYALFGNALDNAIEAARAEKDPERRIVTLDVRRQGSIATISVENYCSSPPEFKDGLPVTTHEDHTRHGFGMRSMRLIAERYGGSLEACMRGDVFSLSAIIPIPASDA